MPNRFDVVVDRYKYDSIDNFRKLGFDYELKVGHCAAYVWKIGYTRKQTLENMALPVTVPVYHDPIVNRLWLPWDGIRYWLPDEDSNRKED